MVAIALRFREMHEMLSIPALHEAIHEPPSFPGGLSQCGQYTYFTKGHNSWQLSHGIYSLMWPICHTVAYRIP